MRLPEVHRPATVTGEYPADDRTRSHPTDDATCTCAGDPSTMRIVPWAVDPTAQVIHDCFDDDGRLVPIRAALRCCAACCDLYDGEGLEAGRRARARVLPGRAEHRPRHAAEAADRPQRPRGDRRARPTAIDAVNEFDPLFEDIYDYCEAMELDVDTLIHEVGAGADGDQLPPRRPARRWPTRCSCSSARCARRRCATTCTPPSWPSRWPASRAARCTCTRAWSTQETGDNIFSNADGRRHGAVRSYIGGLQSYVPSAMALFAPYVNSYRRLARYNCRADQHPVGHRQPHRGHPRCRSPSRRRGASRTA